MSLKACGKSSATRCHKKHVEKAQLIDVIKSMWNTLTATLTLTLTLSLTVTLTLTLALALTLTLTLTLTKRSD